MTEYGIFSDEGLVESAIQTLADAEEALVEHKADAEAAGANPEVLFLDEICPEHEEQPRDSCEDCAAEDETCEEEL